MHLIEKLVKQNVYDNDFASCILELTQRRVFEVVIYGGRIYGVDFFQGATDTGLKSGVSSLPKMGETDELIAMILHQYLRTVTDSHLFALDFTSAACRYPRFDSTDCGDIKDFMRAIVGSPSAFVVARGESFLKSSDAVIACIEVSDGDAWLVFGS